MLPRLVHIYGPLWVYSYGFMIALGLLVFFVLARRHSLRVRFIPELLFDNAVMLGVIAGIVGGRIAYTVLYPEVMLAGPWWELFLPWVGGLAIHGAIAAIFLTCGLYLHYNRVPVLSALDLLALYGPLMQAIARFGCLLAGCCYGAPAPAGAWWAVTFSDPHGLAPLHVALHPTQLYLALASFGIFLVMQALWRLVTYRPGVLVAIGCMLEALARFGIDFVRADRGILFYGISRPQMLAGFGFVASALWLMYLLRRSIR